ncbi:MAG: phosphate ABC transporter, permease protein PstA [Firmicutes bacterium HGW-Firmicutes-3]|jgi:phosphate transport system permease protein|nr:MAG: phosphate ABC transporter, permease protein PstA [Firmicutes bacterium HGW-Firmicutes-3]
MEAIQKSYINDRVHVSLKPEKSKKKLKEAFAYGIIGLATAFTVSILVWIIGFIFIQGAPHLNWQFLIKDFDSISSYVEVKVTEGSENQLGVLLEFKDIHQFGGNDKTFPIISKIEDSSNVKDAMDRLGNPFPLREGDTIDRISGKTTEGMTMEEIYEAINANTDKTMLLRVSREGGGIYPMIVTTLMMIGLSLIIACPIGILAAIYLVEYAKPGRLVRTIRFATESLAGIPSIIYGLFGMLFFVTYLKLNYSILAGALTLSIILLPVIIRQTEESLKSVPMTYREGSLGLGATKLMTIRRAVLPSAIPGIVVAIILSIGRIVGESAALLLTAGTAAKIPSSIFESGATLTIKAYTSAKEEADIGMACAIGAVIIIIIFILNGSSKLISRSINKSV